MLPILLKTPSLDNTGFLAQFGLRFFFVLSSYLFCQALCPISNIGRSHIIQSRLDRASILNVCCTFPSSPSPCTACHLSKLSQSVLPSLQLLYLHLISPIKCSLAFIQKYHLKTADRAQKKLVGRVFIFP